MFFAGYGCSFRKGTASFRTARGIEFIPALLLMMGLPFLPRSSRVCCFKILKYVTLLTGGQWLAKVGRTGEAIKTLANIQAHGNVDDPLVVAEWEEIWTVLEAERQAPAGWRKFFSRGMWRCTVAGMSVQ